MFFIIFVVWKTFSYFQEDPVERSSGGVRFWIRIGLPINPLKYTWSLPFLGYCKLRIKKLRKSGYESILQFCNKVKCGYIWISKIATISSQKLRSLWNKSAIESAME